MKSPAVKSPVTKSLAIGLCALMTVLLLSCQHAEVNTAKSEDAAITEQTSVAINRSDLLGVWSVEYIVDRPVVDYSPARIQFTAEGDINGNASCNRFFGTYSYSDQQLAIASNLGVTKMMCLPALMEQEQRLLDVLPHAVQASLVNGLLILHDAQGVQLIRAARDEH